MKEPQPLQQVERTRVLYKKRKFSYFAGCDYFRLASHPTVMRAVSAGLQKYGLNVAASRLTTGNHALFGKLETTLVRFFKAPAALLVANGYATNIVVAQALRGDFSHVLIDARAHMSLRDASRFFNGQVLEFAHRSAEDCRRIRAGLGRDCKPIVLTDGVFSHDGGIAPLREYLKILGPGGMLLVDDAHGAGVVGQSGRGTLEFTGVPRARVIQTVTLSKAFGVYGGAILCSRPLRERMISSSAMFVGSTPLPLPLANAALAAIEVLRKDSRLRRRLTRNVDYVKGALNAAGFSIPTTPAPVIAITPRNSSEAGEIKRRLMARGIFPSFIRYPGGPPAGYFRLVISSEHSREQLNDLLGGLEFLAERRRREYSAQEGA